MNKLSQILNYLIVVLVLAIAGAFFYFKNSEKIAATVTPKTEQDLSVKEQDEVVNKYLQATNQSVLLDKAKADRFLLEARAQIAKQEKANREKQDRENEKIPLEQQIWKEPKVGELDSPADIVNSKINEKKFKAQADEIDKKAFAREWIENARKGGYHIELNENLEVIKSVPIRKPSQDNDAVEFDPSE
ncbi:MAG: hypothetical protein ABL930_01540 [Pseudobdellovibrio sp.]